MDKYFLFCPSCFKNIFSHKLMYDFLCNVCSAPMICLDEELLTHSKAHNKLKAEENQGAFPNLPFDWIIFQQRKPLPGDFVQLWFKTIRQGNSTNTFCFATYTGDRFIFEGSNRSNDLENLYAWKKWQPEKVPLD